jgi:hypothetical protein
VVIVEKGSAAARQHGCHCEDFVKTKIQELGFKEVIKKNSVHYDILVDDNIKIEVKSSWICKHNGNRANSSGRFRFTSKEQRDKIIQDNVWVCFVVRSFDQKMIIGFVEGSHVSDKSMYIPLPRLMRYRILSLQEWAEKVSYG